VYSNLLIFYVKELLHNYFTSYQSHFFALTTSEDIDPFHHVHSDASPSDYGAITTFSTFCASQRDEWPQLAPFAFSCVGAD
jgi:hypothetical protein